MLESSELDLVAALRKKVRDHKPCKGYGHVLRDDKMVECECRVEAQYEYRLAHSGIPPKFRRLGFKDYAYKDSPAFAKVQQYLAEAKQHRLDGVGLYLHGPSYTGKSLLACSLLMELMRQGQDCKYLSFDGLLDSKEDRALLRAIEHSWDFLVMDRVADVLNRLSNFREGLFTGDRIHGAVEFLTALISKRVNSGRPIIIPSSVSISDINEKFPSLASALVGSYIHVECEDKGFRQKRIELMMEPDK